MSEDSKKKLKAVVIAVLALIAAALPYFGSDIEISEHALEAAASLIVVAIGIAANTWTNWNSSTASQKGQLLTDALKDFGDAVKAEDITYEDVALFVQQFKNKNDEGDEE